MEYNNLSHTLRGVGFNPACFYRNFWVKGRGVIYDCIGTHTDSIQVVAKYPPSIFYKLKVIYMMKSFGSPKVHMGCNYTQVKVVSTT